MAWIRAIVEACTLNSDRAEIYFDELSWLIIKYYWNQTIFFDLSQGPSSIQQLVAEAIKSYKASFGSQPVHFTKVEDRINIDIDAVSNYLNKDVSWRFPQVDGKRFDFYELDRKKKKLTVRRPDLLKEYNHILFELINFKWTQILENFNSSPRIAKKVKGTAEERVKRGNLAPFKELLTLENPELISFVTDKAIPVADLSIDHVIPWSYMYSDDLWNLVYIEKAQNSSKNDRIPDEWVIDKLEQRNIKLLELMNRPQNLSSKNRQHRADLQEAIERNFVRRYWIDYKG